MALWTMFYGKALKIKHFEAKFQEKKLRNMHNKAFLRLNALLRMII